MFEEWLVLLIYPWFNPIFWLVAILTLITYLIVKKIWLVTIISFIISILLFVFVLSPESGLLNFGHAFELKMAFFSSIYSVLLVWLGNAVARKFKWARY